MKENIPPYRITDKMINLVSSISEKLGRLGEHRDLSASPNMKKNNRIKEIYGTMKLESCLLSLQNVRTIYEENPIAGDLDEIHEVQCLKELYDSISSIDPFSISELKKAQAVMGKYSLDQTGEFRQSEEVVFLGDSKIFVTPQPSQVPDLMNNLFLWMRSESANIHPLIMGAVFHYILLLIHPFSKFNGEISRFWNILILYKWKALFEYIPLESVIESVQDDYYNVVAECNKKGSFESFIVFDVSLIVKSLDETSEKQKNPVMETSEYVKKLLAVMEYDMPYPMLTLMDMVGLKSRVSFRNNYIVPALELGLIRMTIPDKPNSKNQRYIKG